MNRTFNKILIVSTIILLSLSSIYGKTIKVACVGNSVTFGMGIENPEERYPALLQVMLGNEYEVRNFGHSGATLLKNGYRPYWNLPEFKDALNYGADIVIIHLGLNDTDPRAWPKYRDEFIRDYINLIDTFKSINPNTDVKISRMTPIFSGHTRFESSTRDWYWQVQDAIETIAEISRADLIDMHTPLHRRPDLFPDNLHPTGEGAKIIAETVYGAITGNFGGLQLASIFTSEMVLQRNKPIRFWGIADTNEIVEIKFNNQIKSGSANKFGNWEIEFPPLEAGGPYSIKLSTDSKTITINDVLIGDIWLCSGQSNMEFRLNQSSTGPDDIKNATLPEVRLYNMQPIAYTNNIAWDKCTLDKINRLDYFIETEWENSTPETSKDFSAIAYHFGKTVYKKTGVPIGLILNAVGGSPAESWIDRYTLEHQNRFVGMFRNWNNNDFIHPWCRERAQQNSELSENPLQRHPYHPSYLYEAGIQSLTKFNITGVIWYQGESNEHNVELHEELFPTLVESWRNSWNDNFPFYYVQLSSMAIGRETWGHFRDSQRRLMYEIPNCGMAVSSDLGDSTDVHPREKKQIGERLARWALNQTYGFSDTTPSGPLYHDFFVVNDTVFISFDYSLGLKSADGEPLRSFEVAEFPGLFYPAMAEIEGNVVKVNSSKVKNPKYIRYGWNSFSDGNLVNQESLPASTFSTQY